MEFVEGVHLRDWISGKPSIEDRQRVAEAILDLYITEFFKNGFVQTDPNLANFLVRPDAKNRPQLILLDCGAALKYSPSFIARYKNLVQTLSDESESSIIKHCEEAEFLDSRESQDVKQLFVAMVRASVIPFQNQHQPFDFANKEYSKQIRDLVIEFSRRSRFTGPPQEFIFLHRKLGGVFHILKMLESKIDLSPYWAKAFDRSKTFN
jgi:predicted unusual protein kinase regulating ubiquinone biosynthesis (AarF/ABC1/UbiB family)